MWGVTFGLIEPGLLAGLGRPPKGVLDLLFGPSPYLPLLRLYWGGLEGLVGNSLCVSSPGGVIRASLSAEYWGGPQYIKGGAFL